MNVALIVAVIVLLVFTGVIIALAMMKNPSAQDAVTEDVITKALTGPVPIQRAHARLEPPKSPTEPESESK